MSETVTRPRRLVPADWPMVTVWPSTTPVPSSRLAQWRWTPDAPIGQAADWWQSLPLPPDDVALRALHESLILCATALRHQEGDPWYWQSTDRAASDYVAALQAIDARNGW